MSASGNSKLTFELEVMFFQVAIFLTTFRSEYFEENEFSVPFITTRLATMSII
jgi:hypothetical protein